MARQPCGKCGKAQAVRPGKLCNKCYSETSKAVKTEQVALNKVRIDGGTQARVGVNEAVVADYAEAIGHGAKFPPVVLFFDGVDYWLGDGFHRVLAALRVHLTSVEAEVREGTQRDALLYAVGANATHGLRRTNADKRKAVLTLLGDQDWSQWSNCEIARRCGVSESLVRSNRPNPSSIKTKMDDGQAAPLSVGTSGDDDYDEDQDREDGTPADATTQPAVRQVQRNGKTYEMQTERIGKPARTPEGSQDGPLDGEGKPLPDCLRDVFGDKALPECIAGVDAIISQMAELRLIGRLRSRLQSLPFLLAGELEQRVEEASAALLSARELLVAGTPHAVCECCLGQGCRECRQAGYLPQWKLDELRRQERLAS